MTRPGPALPRPLPLLLALALLLLSGCARDREARLRNLLSSWFFVDETVYFSSRRTCTAAIFSVVIGRPRPGFAVQRDPISARDALNDTGIAALRMEGYSPHDLTDTLLLMGDGAFGSEALHAGALAEPCLDSDGADRAFFAALTRPGATLVYDAGSAGLIILDPVAMRLFYLGGDVW